MQNGRGWADRRVSMVGGERGPCPPPLEMEKKDAVRGNFNLFHLCFTNEIKGESIHYTVHAKWKGVVGQVRVHGRGGEGALPPSLEIGKKEAVRGNFNVFHLYFTTFLI